jgi:O-Antigen ligase.
VLCRAGSSAASPCSINSNPMNTVQKSVNFPANRSIASGHALRWDDLAFVVLVTLTGVSLFSGVETRIAGKIVRPFDALITLSAGWMMLAHLSLTLKALERVKGIVLAWTLLIAIRAASAFFNGLGKDAVVVVIQGGEFVMLLLAVAVATRNVELRELFIKWFLLLVSAIAVYAFVLHVGGGMLANLKRLDEPKYSFGFVCVFLVGAWISGRPRMPSWVRIGLIIPAIALLLISGERSAWLGMIGVAAAFVRLGIFSLRSRNIARLILPMIGLLVLGSVTVVVLAHTNEFVSRQMQRFAEPITLVDWKNGEIFYQYAESPSNKARLFQVANLIDIAKTMPLTGTGTELYRYYAYSRSAGSGLSVISGMHGQYTLFFAENGVLAFALYCMIWILFFRGWRKLWGVGNAGTRESLLFVYAVGIYSAIITWFIAGGSAGLFITFLPIGLLGGILLQTRPSAKGFRGGAKSPRRSLRSRVAFGGDSIALRLSANKNRATQGL